MQGNAAATMAKAVRVTTAEIVDRMRICVPPVSQLVIDSRRSCIRHLSEITRRATKRSLASCGMLEGTNRLLAAFLDRQQGEKWRRYVRLWSSKRRADNPHMGCVSSDF